MEIIWKGNQNTNSSSREGYVPFVIVNHISTSTMNSMDAWFTDPNNHVSSAHFGVAKDGTIHQYVQIERMAWAQGITQDKIKYATAQVVHDMGVNPNYYCVSIEHEGTDGDLTNKQFEATVWVHQYIQNYILLKWGKSFPLDRYHVIGHFQVSPTNKPNCPGPKFPWERLYAALAKKTDEGEEKEMEELRKRIAELEKENRDLAQRLQRLENLQFMDEIPGWAQESVDRAVAQGIVTKPDNGSYDFYRFLTILHKKGIL